MTEVYLAIYDLSQGMARHLSIQFLGPNHAIDMIPHTALLVFGKEYFFGGGIQSVDPHYFRSMTGRRPVQTERLGTTQVTQHDFDRWCQQVASVQYNATTYDLLHRNCNHFSQEAATQGLQLSQGVPAWILQVPHKFLSSPMGQMMRPMLEQMQITQTSPVQAPPIITTTNTVSMQPAMGLSSSSSSSAGSVPARGHNPWASMAESSSTTGTSSSSSSNSRSGSTQAKPPPPKAETGSSRPITPPLFSSSSDGEGILKKYTSPMLSNDTKSLPLCASKLTPHLNSEATQLALAGLSKALQDQQYHSAEDSVDVVVRDLWKLVQEGKVVSFSLLFLRLVVLHYPQSKAVTSCMSELMQSLLASSSNHDDEQVRDDSKHSSGSNPPLLFTTPASKSLAWCVTSNYTGSSASKKPQFPKSEEPRIPSYLVEAAIRDWNDDAVQVRQAACTFLYNYVLGNGPQLDNDEETVVSLVCSSLESLVEESDPTTRLRMLVVGARVVFGVHHHHNTNTAATATSSTSPTRCKEESSTPHWSSPSSQTIEGPGYNEMAKDLIQDLGFISLLQELAVMDYCDDATPSSPASSTMNSHPDTIECRQLALELIDKFQSTF